jgi:hypothetical protein
MNEDAERLLERLQTGWNPNPDDIPSSIEQCTLTDWRFVVGRRNRKPALFGNTGLLTGSGKPWFDLTAEVMYMDLRIALCADDRVWWLGCP